ncbi:SDR family NAD(P)-dependent oxidoreductase [Microvirga roseola]|uniref:SDR family NAD(P)-dependent oxidoreductase n=1 Tax=Microvirga roseola TaxID=2883126 RepID=UPI001E2B39A2|nr:SDR family NAD(P)-dependent oxidoreductase [Microvirga roseola]
MSHDPAHPLKGQKALVTGARSGIGTATARAFAAAGAAVGVNYRSHADEAERIAHEIRNAGGDAVALKADESSEDEVRATFDELGSAFWPRSPSRRSGTPCPPSERHRAAS